MSWFVPGKLKKNLKALGHEPVPADVLSRGRAAVMAYAVAKPLAPTRTAPRSYFAWKPVAAA